MTAADAPKQRPAGRVTLHNRLPPRHAQRLALEAAIRSALRGFAGAWDVTLEAPEGLTLAIAVLAPDGSSWTLSCGSPAHGDPESIAETVRAACSRRRWLNPEGAARADAPDPVELRETRPEGPGGKRA